MHAKTIWISDVHLGSTACKAEKILAFLKTLSCETLILNGDIIDGWRLQRKWYFPQSHLLVLRKIIGLSKKINVVYCSGNHDEFLRKFTEFDLNIGNIQIVNKHVHTINGLRCLSIHGDGWDMITKYSPWIAKLGDTAYNVSIWLNTHFNNVRYLLGMKYWSLSKYLKNTVKNAVSFIFAFEHAAINSAKNLKYDMVCCGHIHNTALYKHDGIIYANSGDWCETCSWVVETHDGKLQIWEWNDGDPILINELTLI